MSLDTLTTENHSDRIDAIRKLKRSYKDHLGEELNEQLKIIETRKKDDTPATTEDIGRAYHAAIGIVEAIDNTEAFLKSWTPPPAENQPAITSKGPPQAEWLIDNWMPKGEVTILSGRGEIGKSHIALQIACAFACGWPKHYLDIQHNPQQSDLKPIPPLKTMIATWEDSHGSVQRRIHRIKDTMRNWLDIAKVEKNVLYRDMKPQGPIWIPGTESGHIANRGILSNPGHDLLHDCKKKEIDLLVLDSIVAVYGQDLNTATHVRHFLNTLGAWCNDTGITILLIGHPNKHDDKDISGSVDWKNGVRAVWTLTLEDDDADTKQYYSLNHWKVNDAPKQPSKYLKRENGIWVQTTKERAIKAYAQYQTNLKDKEKEAQNDTTSGINV